MKITNFSLTNKEVLELIPFINQIGLNNLSDSGRLKRKKRLGVWVYDKNSVTSFLNSINTNDYLSLSDTKVMLETNGIKDIFKRFSNKDETLKCNYRRVTNQFPMSVKNLIKFGYLDVVDGVSPMMIKKDSVVKTIKHFKGVIKSKPTPSISKVSKKKKPLNNSDYNSILLSLLQKVS
ncbi:hypothetical protein CPG37_10880 [Malaciobacter canalis]|uniref:Uncharacterized protein n=1 Tax=Malaciobacter canalis TaxID=1912871 RepID=A0ABX4LMJ7_9BACT|nr:hypothetical protein [Malaciobacter canalis]PHO09094.1 hypothetical protein CPG37_10880 [Malaciobacter canalis]QEE31802.1 hypothetical protein ACAN_0291 [Malaciobacter canalis]